MKRVILLAFLMTASVVFAETRPIENYQSIIDRQMFGALPPGFDPSKSPNEVQKTSAKEEKQLTQEQEKLKSAIHFSVINVTPEGVTAVGFTDNSNPKAPVHYYLKVGEKRNGWEVKEADPIKATMTIANGDIVVPLTLGGNSATDGGTARAGGAAAAEAAADGNRRARRLSGPLLGGSQRARRLQRRQEEKEEAAKAREEQAAKAREEQAAKDAQAEQEKQQHEAERAEMRMQLQSFSEQLRKMRDSKAPENSAAESE